MGCMCSTTFDCSHHLRHQPRPPFVSLCPFVFFLLALPSGIIALSIHVVLTYPLSSTRLCDEATSALDSTTEAEILNSLKTLANDRTSIFIAHRLTTAMQSDEIIVLENGKVVEQGPHEVLLSRAGRYAELWAHQNSNDAVNTTTDV